MKSVPLLSNRPKRPMTLAYKSLLALLAAGAPNALAHAVWAEPSPENLVVLRFGDYGKKVEKSPGALDRIAGAKAWSIDKDGKPVAGSVEKNSDHLLLKDISADGAAFAEITSLPVRAHGKNPPSKSNFYIRWQPAGASATTPVMTLDIVPAGKPGEVKVFLRGAPLAGAKLELFAPGAEKPLELTTDAQGAARFDAAKSGGYLLECSHREPLPGFHEGVAYAATGHVASLMLTVSAAK